MSVLPRRQIRSNVTSTERMMIASQLT